MPNFPSFLSNQTRNFPSPCSWRHFLPLNPRQSSPLLRFEGNPMTHPMIPMSHPVQFTHTMPQPWFPILPSAPPFSTAFWQTTNVLDRLQDLRNTIDLAKAMKKELEGLIRIKDSKGSAVDVDTGSTETSLLSLPRFLDDNKIDLLSRESCPLQAANAIISKLGAQLKPFGVVTNETSPWEEKSAAVRLANKMQKSKRNKNWRKRKRRRIAEMLAKEHEQFDKADQEADEWRAREIANVIAKRKVEKMKEIAKLKAKEEKKILESELELVLIVEKLQELRSIRIQKLKKQGHFLPEEDDKFLEKVQAAVEEEERQEMAAADTDAAKEAIATAEDFRKIIQTREPDLKVASGNNGQNEDSQDQTTQSENIRGSSAVTGEESRKLGSEGQSHVRAYDSVAGLPIEFYHYYHGSNTDMGTLIEVRRTWDQYIRPGGRRIPGHWVRPPPPADDLWASYLVQPE
ncbi:hypothetical protein CsSME_00023796 [Camellia sinensis var. sinensis]|uniref:U11/U12 small nuclear ribonucleoprotein 59 kDa protein-like n=1 Tax=Camellia sinensis TaxID=4442 RepID=UPI001035F0E7|nr:U11/U12 small nuclear ribonucleoprotein 59 kDa protein-like [Camellia sinensis]XP_028103359.1 U11/U12 small nuclear ribonucleoprotein 59 kDa protein-like [Camellia sinensis]XP_028103360.1 U11/U12 small nuclear ribonucleoprotein 59 kDa protein-like [Camellia sinensis]XP_028103361.1 U11/U12 small nuclear ribonucleoprotein 59 kDa protein-like [Camellia sinensis]XP_028103362.1 U11/U12 small nuclear ribonucleoprotein 59 kDa protein-like [Camellia sinensis]